MRTTGAREGAREPAQRRRGGRVLSVVPEAQATPPTRREYYVIVGAVFCLCLIGLPVVLSASAVPSLYAGASVYSLFERQLVFLALGCVAAVVFSHVSPDVLRRLRVALPAAAFALLVVVFLPGIGHAAGGSSRWIGAGPIQLQPSEFMKLALVVFAADLLARRGSWPHHFRSVVQPLLIVLALAGILIMKQPDLGTCIVLCCIVFSLLYAAGVPGRTIGGSFFLVAVPGAALALDASYRRDRLFSFLNPWAHASSTGYQVVQSLVTLGEGGLRGNGVGASPSTWGYLPNGHTDFIFAVIGGNFGLLGTLGTVALFGALGWAGLVVARREEDPFTRYLAVGVTCWLIAQAVINIGGVIDALPVTGIPLPFVSYGGSSLVVALSGAGLLAGIARRQAPLVAPAVVPASSSTGASRAGRRRPSEATS